MTDHATNDETGPRAKRKRDRQASERALLDAGIEIFSRDGYDAATTKRIAAQAGLNEQLLTRYFGGKAGLLVAVYEDFIQAQRNDDIYDLLALAPSVREEVERFLNFKHEHLVRIEKLLKILLPRLLVDPAARERANLEVIGGSVRMLERRLAGMQEQAILRPDVDVKSLSLTIVTHAFGISFLLRSVAAIPDAYAKADFAEFAKNIAAGVASC